MYKCPGEICPRGNIQGDVLHSASLNQVVAYACGLTNRSHGDVKSVGIKVADCQRDVAGGQRDEVTRRIRQAIAPPQPPAAATSRDHRAGPPGSRLNTT